jgi:hypothetical protein
MAGLWDRGSRSVCLVVFPTVSAFACRLIHRAAEPGIHKEARTANAIVLVESFSISGIIVRQRANRHLGVVVRRISTGLK